MTVIGVDVGGTSIKGGRADEPGVLHLTVKRSTPTGSADELIEAVVELVERLRTDDLAAVGVIVPGAVDGGVVRYAANLPMRGVDLRARLESELGVPVAVGHDVAAAAEAEAEATGIPDLLYVAIGTGVAAANLRDGRADRGATGQAGEIGHVVAIPGGEACVCGNRGCVEVYASAAAIGRRYRELTGHGDADARYVSSVIDTDGAAAEVWAEAIDALAAGLATAVMLLDPAVIVVGGGLSGAGERLLEPVRKTLAERCTWRTPPPVRRSMLGDLAGHHGAARLALRLANEKEQSA